MLFQPLADLEEVSKFCETNGKERYLLYPDTRAEGRGEPDFPAIVNSGSQPLKKKDGIRDIKWSFNLPPKRAK